MNPLTDLIPAAARKYLYAAAAAVGLVVGALAVAGKDVETAQNVLTYVVVALGITAASNVNKAE